MGRTNIKTPPRGSEYFIRPYARGKNDTYMDVSQQVTQSYVDTQVVMPHSIFSRPYLADAYPEMEYEYKPTIPVIPPFDPTTVPGGVLIVPEVSEVPEVPCYTPGSWEVNNHSIEPTGRPRSVGFENNGTNYSWATILGLSTGNASDVSLFLRPGFQRANWRWFLYFDLTDFCGTVSSADITIPLVYVSVDEHHRPFLMSLHQGTFNPNASNFSWYGGIDRVSEYWDIQEITGTASDDAYNVTWSLSSTGLDYMTAVLDSGSKIVKFSITTYLHDIQGVQPDLFHDIFINSVTGAATMNFIIV